MNDKEAIRLLDDTFSSEFDLRKFTHFLNELFNGFYPQDKSIITHKEYEQHIISIKKIGNFRQKEKSMEILIVKLKKGTSLDKARTMQRNVVAKLLRNFNIDSALVAFISEDSPDWRFSFIKMDYKLAEDGRVSEDLTPARRYSFLVGPNEPNHTCRKQFLELVKNEKQKPSIEEIENAFSIERVTKEFFEKYKNLYFKLKDNLDKLVENDKNLREEFEDKEISTVDFSKKLLGQIVFLYFLQKKGWLGIKRDKERKFEQWGQGPKNFIKELFEKAKQEKKNFFNDFLEPLFYEALAEDRRANDNYYSRFDCKIPFLNGGLFEPINDYNWGETDINLDNSIFEEILGTFNEFNFTIKEDEPLEKEVAIDPEMLGKVFENLIEDNIRKGQGAYYTPREIVHYMCQQSLINYLETNIKLPKKDIEFFIQKGDLALEYLRRFEFGKPVNKNAVFPETIIKNAEELDKLLVEIKICDPTVGSGAFPVGMMNEIIKARTILSYILKKQKSDYDLKRETIENSLYGVDIEPSAVEITKLRFWLSLIVDEEDINNINPLPNLGNKIMCGNSLLEEFEGIKLFDEKLLGVVEEDKFHESSRIENEMSNLYQELGKIHTGKQKYQNGRSKEIQKAIKKLQKQRNELAHGKKENGRNMTLEEASEQKIKESQKKLKELRELQQKFFNEQNRSQKKKYTQQIDKIEWDLIEETLKEQGNEEAIKKLQQYKRSRSKPFFLWKLYFADVFQRDNPGFDVVIANPPYVRQEVFTDIKEYLKNEFKEFFNGRADLYTYFYYKGVKLLSNNGTLVYITSNKFFVRGYGENTRRLLSNKVSLQQIINFGELPVFQAAVDSAIILAKNCLPKENENIISVQVKKTSEIVNLDYTIKKNKVLINHKDLNSKEWVLENPKKIALLKKIRANKISLGKYCNNKIFAGIKTGLDSAFVIDLDTKERLISLDPKSKEVIKPWLRGKDVRKWKADFKELYVIYIPLNKLNINDFPAIKDYLGKFKDILIKRATNQKWFEMQQPQERFTELFNSSKIIYPDCAKEMRACYDVNQSYGTMAMYFMPFDQLIMGILNSSLFDWYSRMTFATFGDPWKGGRIIFKSMYMRQVPIPTEKNKETKEITELVDQILSITKDDGYLDNPDKKVKVKKLEKEIDQLVYKLYELTPEEIKIVEEFNKEK